MSPRGRLVVFLIAAAVFGGVLVRATRELPAFGQQISGYAEELNQNARPLRHSTDAVTAVVFDFRGIDTLGEEFILLAAVSGVMLLLRPLREDEYRKQREDAVEPGGGHTPLLKLAARLLVPLAVILGFEISTHGHLTPGGGFQGGVVVGAAFAALYVLGHYRAFHAFAKPALGDALEGSAMAACVAIGFIAVSFGAPYFTNVLPLGDDRAFLAAGTIWALDLAVGVAVGAGLMLLPATFIDQLARIRRKLVPEPPDEERESP